ncbi:unnamed protein product [Didymodactylos carnosus]|uniref:Oxysterol-binding protein n=2 Tax=Didymodactylos carnosus TaxID=1234261 RepID=A0A813ZG36_9BILA|nr:unnamed protein product [Didymodactylos carnosus]CAF3681798.1 unnamed protein product [Didymodactylos carnosus]
MDPCGISDGSIMLGEPILTIFDNLNNLYKRLSLLAVEQNSRSPNGLHSTSSTIFRHSSVFYDAPEAFDNLLLSDKEECDKMSESESSSDDEKPPQIKWRRSSLPAVAPDSSNIKLWDIMRKAIGKDLSRVAMPVILNEPLGLLQKLCEELEYTDLLDKASQTDDKYQRMVYVTAFIISTYSANYYRTGRKNFNPLLGETYECIREDKGWKFIAEQKVMKIEASQYFTYQLQAKVKFWGKSMEILPDSLNILTSPKYNETIVWNKVTMCIHNLLSNDRWYSTDLLVENSNGTTARISFMQSQYRTRLNNVAGDIENEQGEIVHKLFGHWHNDVFCGNDQTAKCIWKQSAVLENSKQYYGFTRFAIELNELDDDLKEQLPPTDSRFRPDQRLLELGDTEAAEKEKARIEDAQRQRTRERPEEYRPIWFDVNHDQQSYKPKNNFYWTNVMNSLRDK